MGIQLTKGTPVDIDDAASVGMMCDTVATARNLVEQNYSLAVVLDSSY